MKRINENAFDVIRRFTDAFFDGLKTKAVDNIIQKAQNAGVPSEVTELMNQIARDSEELEELVRKAKK